MDDDTETLLEQPAIVSYDKDPGWIRRWGKAFSAGLVLVFGFLVIVFFMFQPCKITRSGCVKIMSLWEVMAKPTRDNVRALLTGKNKPPPRPEYPDGVGGKFDKFDAKGNAQVSPGNTIICHLNRSSSSYQTLVGIQKEFKNQPFASAYTYLPPSTFHMTLADGLNEKKRNEGAWSSYVALNATMDDATKVFKARLKDFDGPITFRIRPRAIMGGINVVVGGVDEAEDWKIWRTRGALLSRLGIRSGQFVFHISFAYLIRWLTPEEANIVYEFSQNATARLLSKVPEIVLGPAEFCDYKTMHKFDILKVLNRT